VSFYCVTLYSTHCSLCTFPNCFIFMWSCHPYFVILIFFLNLSFHIKYAATLCPENLTLTLLTLQCGSLVVEYIRNCGFCYQPAFVSKLLQPTVCSVQLSLLPFSAIGNWVPAYQVLVKGVKAVYVIFTLAMSHAAPWIQLVAREEFVSQRWWALEYQIYNVVTARWSINKSCIKPL